MGFEPTTSTLARLHSTTELLPQKDAFGSSLGRVRQALALRRSTPEKTELPAFYWGSEVLSKSSHITSLASMSVVLSPRPSRRQG